MPLTVVLAVGLDSSLLESQSPVWQSSGYIVTFTNSIKEAISRLRDGDFDLVLLGYSISAASRERLMFLIRSTGSQIPVVEVPGFSEDCDTFAGITVKKQSMDFLEGIGAIMADLTRSPSSIPAVTRFEE
jgi:DNA-binding NtrC family response regulator